MTQCQWHCVAGPAKAKDGAKTPRGTMPRAGLRGELATHEPSNN